MLNKTDKNQINIYPLLGLVIPFILITMALAFMALNGIKILFLVPVLLILPIIFIFAANKLLLKNKNNDIDIDKSTKSLSFIMMYVIFSMFTLGIFFGIVRLKWWSVLMVLVVWFIIEYLYQSLKFLNIGFLEFLELKLPAIVAVMFWILMVWILKPLHTYLTEFVEGFNLIFSLDQMFWIGIALVFIGFWRGITRSRAAAFYP